MAADPLALLMRWLHISSVAFLFGGALYAYFVLAPAARALADSARQQLGDSIAAQIRIWVIGVIVALLGSGLYNLLNKPALPKGYHVWFGIKMLLVLHVFAVSLLLLKPGVGEARRNRLRAGIVVSGLIIVFISAYLRWISA